MRDGRRRETATHGKTRKSRLQIDTNGGVGEGGIGKEIDCNREGEAETRQRNPHENKKVIVIMAK